jgi:hypothetical protein
VLAGLEVARLDASRELPFFLGREERDFVDLVEIRLQTAFGRNGWSPALS